MRHSKSKTTAHGVCLLLLKQKNMPEVSYRQIRAVFFDDTVRVYQAYNDEIADAALAAGTFVPPFSMTRMTWIKPSFLWMMYRSGWGQKDERQRRILAIDITRDGFEWALRNASLSHGDNIDKSKPVRIQWDPERDIDLGKLEYRSIQIGLSGFAVEKYVNEWIVRLTEVTDLAEQIRASRDESLLPAERPYPISEEIADIIHCDM